MPDTGWKNANAHDEGGAWGNAANIKVYDGNWAYALLDKNEESGEIAPKTYGANVPAGSVIDGISVRIRRSSNPGSGEDGGDNNYDSWVILNREGTQNGSNKASGTHWINGWVNAYYGGATDLWGLTWTTTQINHANTKVRFKCTKGVGTLTSFYVDVIQIKVYYHAEGFTDIDEIWGIPVTDIAEINGIPIEDIDEINEIC